MTVEAILQEGRHTGRLRSRKTMRDETALEADRLETAEIMRVVEDALA